VEKPALAHASFQEVYRAELQYVANVVRRLGVEPTWVEDLTHDVFMAAYRRRDSYDRSRPIRPWLFAFALHRVSAHRERAAARREVAADEPAAQVPDDAPGPDAVVERREAQSLVVRALDALDLDKRAVFILHEIDGCPIPEAAHALGIPLNTAYSRLRLGRQLFETAVRRLQKEVAR
jgi:RNA polymerase sigma-70 factor (ECF subfamily)